MCNKQPISTQEAHEVGTQLGFDWKQINLEQFRRGLEVELEQGEHDADTVVTQGYLILLGKFVWARLIIWSHIREMHEHFARADQAQSGRENVAFGD